MCKTMGRNIACENLMLLVRKRANRDASYKINAKACYKITFVIYDILVNRWIYQMIHIISNLLNENHN